MNLKFDNQMHVHLEKHDVSDIDVARAAWVSNYGADAREKDAGKVKGLINYLYRNKHMSPFEHGQMTFFIEVPIFVAREWMRHRTWSYNEWSGRYAELEPHFYVPSEARPLVQHGKVGEYTFVEGTADQHDYMTTATQQAYENAWGAYQNMLSAGIAKEVARNVLPVGIYTKFYATVNPRNLMAFLSLRTDPTALEEIRVAAEAVELIFKDLMPLTHAAYSSGAVS